MTIKEAVELLDDKWVNYYFCLEDKQYLDFKMDKIREEFYQDELDKLNLTLEEKQEVLKWLELQ
jgi:hypothetical protein